MSSDSSRPDAAPHDEPGASAEPDWVRVARIGKPHGIKGEVTVRLFTDAPEERFAPGAVLYTSTADRAPGTAVTTGATATTETGRVPAELTVTRARWNKEILVVAFAQSADRNTAETLRGTELFAVPEPEVDDDAWYEDDLVGLAVVKDGARIGTVSALVTGEAQDLLEVKLSGGQQAFVPFVEQIVPEVDLEAGVVQLTPPPGLLRLNLPDDGSDAPAAEDDRTGGRGETGGDAEASR